MNKKLLLSFAVFATAVSVNAQKRGAKILPENLKSPRNYSVVSDDFPSKSVTNVEKTFNPQINSSKRGVIKNVDTSSFFDLKQRFATAAPSGVTIQPYMNKTNDSVEVTVYSQTIHNKSKAKYTLNGVLLVVGSRNKAKKSSDVNVRIYDTLGNVVANASKNVPYTTGTDFRGEYFIFDKPFTTNEDLTFYVEGKSAYDTVRVYSSGAYRNLAVSCNITGDKLTLVSPAPTSPANIGSGFWVGQEISGTGIAAGTTIKAYNPTSKEYTLSKAATTNGTNVVVAGKSLTFDEYKFSAMAEYYKFPKLQNGEPDLSKKPSYDVSAIHGIAGVGPTDGHLICYPIIEYSYDDAFTSSNLCLGDKSEVIVNENQTNPFLAIARNPLLNKMSFYSLVYGKSYYHGAVFTTSKSFSDSLFQTRNEFKVTYNAKDVTKNDTLVVATMLWKYGYGKPFSQPSMFFKSFLLSSKVTPAANITPVSAGIKCYLYDAKTVLPGIGGIAPYTGLPKFGDAAGKFSVVDVNGCKGDITTTAVITSDMKEIVAKATVTDAKCFGDKTATVEITATGGATPLVIPSKETVTTLGTTKSYVVKDANLCEVKVNAVIKNAPDSLTIKTVTTSATNNTKSDGTIVATVTGGTIAYKYAWENAATKTVSTQTTATLTETAGTFKLTVTDANGCTKVATATIGDKKVSVTELGLTNIAVYPNPVKETLNVRFDATSIATVELVNVAGQVLDSKTNSDVTFNTAGLVAGMYFVNIKVAEGVYTHKIIKE